jgi:hypothetical protein
MRLIDADALKTPIEDRIDNIPSSEYDNGWNNAIYAVIDEIDNAPTVEYPFYQEAYQTGYEEGRKDFERPQVNVIPQECIKVLAEAVVDVTQQIDWKSLCEKVAERPKGKWIVEHDWVHCFPCGHEQNYPSNFCPNCGADMRKGDET